jgi:hypothetical protein
MTVGEFIGQAQGYYGKYRPGALAHIQHYLVQYRDYQLDALWRRVLLDYSGRWNYPPDIAVLEEAARNLDKDSPGYSELAWKPRRTALELPEVTEGAREEAVAVLSEWRNRVIDEGHAPDCPTQGGKG